MHQVLRVWAIIVAVVLAGCSGLGASQPDSTRPPEAASPPSFTPAQVEPVTLFPVLESLTGPYQNAAALLDDVCFEYLLELAGQHWLWTSPADLSAFYDRADSRCPHPAARGTFDFGEFVLAGLVSAAGGCDAAHRVLGLSQDDSTRAQILSVQLEVEPGCPYELVQPLLIAVPRPPDGYTFQVVVLTP